MNTPAHVVFSLALLGYPRAAKYTLAIVCGALLPDVMMLVFYGIERLRGIPEAIIWNQHYYQAGWQAMFDVTNSLPLLVIALTIAVYVKAPVFIWLIVSMMVHCLLDLPVHHDDGHRHFFPFSEFRLQSPISYWDPAHYGRLVSIVEMALVFFGSLYLWWRDRISVNSILSMTRLRWTLLATVLVYLGFVGFVMSYWASKLP